MHGVNGARARFLGTRKSLSPAGRVSKNTVVESVRWVGASGTDFEGANPSHGRGKGWDSIQFFTTIGNIRSAGIEG